MTQKRAFSFCLCLSLLFATPGTRAQSSQVTSASTPQEQARCGSTPCVPSESGNASGQYGSTSGQYGSNAGQYGNSSGQYGGNAGQYGSTTREHNSVAGGYGGGAGARGSAAGDYGGADRERGNVPPDMAPVVVRSAFPDVMHGDGPRSPRGLNDAAAPSSHDFEDLVQSTLGHPLPLFGRGLFTNSPNSFTPADHLGVPSDYVVGPGDELIIRSWGKVDIDSRLTVDRNGQIFLPVVGTVTVAGVPYRQLQSVIDVALRRQYRSFELSVTLGQLRTIQIFVLGRALRPGAYVVNGLSTLVDALFASGGPSGTGTLRDIQVKRDGRVVSHLDLYDLLLHGNKVADIPLIAGDVLFIPPVGMQVAIDGDVNTPGIYEMLPGATMDRLLEDAGGLTAVAGTARSTVERVVDHRVRRSDDFALDAAGLQLPLANGDVVRIFPISPKIENTVTLRGNVLQPGRYTWHAGMRVSDLIPNRDFLLTRAYYHGQNSEALPDNEPLQPGERDKRLGERDKRPGRSLHETEINWNYAAIERLDANDLSTRVVTFALGEAIANPGSAANLQLQPGDSIRIFSVEEIPTAQQERAKFVKIDGEVVAPGTYRMAEGETLRDLVRRAGGFTAHTYLYAGQLTRDSVRKNEEAELKVLLEREQREALSPVNQPHGTTDNPVSAQGELQLRQAYLARLADIHPTGRVVLQMKPDATTVADVPDFALEDGDHYFLPTVPGVVTVLGSVYNQGSFRFHGETRVTHYLDVAGGPTREADSRRDFILRADGSLVSRQSVGGFNKLTLYPGDALVVPPQLKSGSAALALRDWTQILSQFSITALAIKALQN